MNQPSHLQQQWSQEFKLPGPVKNMPGNCPIIECMRPECIPQCGPISWFGNLSDCDVTLEYQTTEGGLWHSLGQFPAGMHTELGGGALYLPQHANLRVIETPSIINPGTPRIIQNWGRVGAGRESLYIDNTMCSKPRDAVPTVGASPCAAPPPCPHSPPNWFYQSIVIVLVLALLLGLVVVVIKKKNINLFNKR